MRDLLDAGNKRDCQQTSGAIILAKSRTTTSPFHEKIYLHDTFNRLQDLQHSCESDSCCVSSQSNAEKEQTVQAW